MAWTASHTISKIVGSFVRDKPLPKWLYVQRALDATPVDVEFDDMASELFAAARYRYLTEDGKWSLIPYEEAQRLKLRCKRGVIELLAQTMCVAWKEAAGFTDLRYSSGEEALRCENIMFAAAFY